MRIYISAAPEDSSHEDRLRRMLTPAVSSFGLTVWGTRDLVAGTIAQREMAKSLVDAWLFILIVSTDSLANKKCLAEMSAALQLAKEGKLRVVSVLVRPCLWQLSEIATLPLLPANQEPLALWKKKDAAWLEIVSGIVAIVQSMQIR